tara:strand:- start:98 stop:433 length:336 start_codon:yes stop_codon:yes gene_type:complete
MKPLYVIVHEHCIEQDLGNPNLCADDWENYALVLGELSRIKNEEDYRELNEGDPKSIPYQIPSEQPVLVCGSYGEFCVRVHVNKLQQEGYDASVHHDGTAYLLTDDFTSLF